MPFKKEKNPGDPLALPKFFIGLFQALPWWAGLLVVIAAYLLLRYFVPYVSPARPELVQVETTTKPITEKNDGWGGFTFWIAPWIAGALGFFWTYAQTDTFIRRKVATAREERAKRRPLEELERLRLMPIDQCRQRIADGYRARTYDVRVPDDPTQDLVMERNGVTTFVDTTPWLTAEVGPETVQALRTRMRAKGAMFGVLITLGRATPEAISAGQPNNAVVFEQGVEVVALIDQGRR